MHERMSYVLRATRDEIAYFFPVNKFTFRVGTEQVHEHVNSAIFIVSDSLADVLESWLAKKLISSCLHET